MPLGSVSDPLNRKMMPSLARPWWLRNEDKCVINGCHFTDPEKCIEGPRFYVVVTITIFKFKFRFFWAIRSNLYSIFSSAEIKLWFSPSIFPNMIAYRCHSYSNNNNKQQQMTRVSLNGNQVMVCRWPPPQQPYLPALLPPIWRDVVRGTLEWENHSSLLCWSKQQPSISTNGSELSNPGCQRTPLFSLLLWGGGGPKQDAYTYPKYLVYFCDRNKLIVLDSWSEKNDLLSSNNKYLWQF